MRRIHAMDPPEWDPLPAPAGRASLAPPLPWRAAPSPDAPMTGAEALRLRRLTREAAEGLAYAADLSGGAARARIASLEAELALRGLPPHTD